MFQVSTGGKRKKDEIYVDSLDFNKKILHTAWHPSENVIAVAATNNLFLLQVNNQIMCISNDGTLAWNDINIRKS